VELGTTQFWVALMQIIGINIVLSGDNAVVIALAARSLSPKQQKQAVLLGSAAAVVMRIILTVAAVELLRFPYLKLVGAVLLLWIGIQLLKPEHEEAGGAKGIGGGMAAAVRTILIADLVMSLDNVIAVAAAAKGSLLLLVVGLLISIPLVIFGSTLLMKLMERWPIIVTIGAALLGYVAGEMAITDPAAQGWVDANAAWLHYGAPLAGAILVVVVGKWLAARTIAEEDQLPVVDLASTTDQPALAAAHTPATDMTGLPVLFAADDSEQSVTASERLIGHLAHLRGEPHVHLVNVQPPAHGDVSTFVGEAELKSYHHDEGRKAVAAVKAKLDAAGVPYLVHIGVGSPSHVIAHYAKETNSRQVFLSKPLGEGVEDFVPIVSEVAGLVDVPVTLV
jgi:YjbE family integral membrane protein